MDIKICQSCGMPMGEAGLIGTEKDESLNHDYCVYCYHEGEFTEDCTMEEMIENCADMLDDYNQYAAEKLAREEAVANMREAFPKLKRWQA